MIEKSVDPIAVLKADLFARPSASLILAASWIADYMPREFLPDWVEVLANGNLAEWTSVIEAAKADILADGVLPSGAQRGQATLSFGALLGLAGLACVVLFFLLTFAAPAIQSSAAAASSNIAIDMSVSHGAAKHGTLAATAIDECFNKNGVWQEWINPSNGRHARICKLDDGKYGIQIIEQINGTWKEITKFVKEKMNSWSQVENYLRNVGYEPIQ